VGPRHSWEQTLERGVEVEEAMLFLLSAFLTRFDTWTRRFKIKLCNFTDQASDIYGLARFFFPAHRCHIQTCRARLRLLRGPTFCTES